MLTVRRRYIDNTELEAIECVHNCQARGQLHSMSMIGRYQKHPHRKLFQMSTWA